jgi:hypothetical protein
MKRLLKLLVVLAACGFASQARAQNSIDIIVSDMKGTHEGTPHGVPSSYDWAAGPRVAKRGAQPDASSIIFWNQVYEPSTLNPSANARVQMRNFRVYVLYNDNKWYLVQSGDTVNAGASYREDFVNDENKPWDATWSSEGWLQVKAGSKSSAGTGYNFHGFPSWWASIGNGANIRAVYSTCQARLVGDSNGKYLLSVGTDLYKADGTNLYDTAIGKFKWVTSSWKSFNMHNLTEDEIRRNPPPINDVGLNWVNNYSFENEQYWNQTPSNWREDQYDANWNKINATASYQESNGGATTGNYHGTHWSSSAYRVYTYQSKVGLPNGYYTLRCRARRSGGQKACHLEAKDYGGSAVTATLPISGTSQQVEIKNINVTSGRCTIGIWSDANANNWAYFDDVEFFRQ